MKEAVNQVFAATPSHRSEHSWALDKGLRYRAHHRGFLPLREEGSFTSVIPTIRIQLPFINM